MELVYYANSQTENVQHDLLYSIKWCYWLSKNTET